MSRNEIKNMGHSVNTRLKNYALQNKIQFEYVLLRYATERFLFRLGKSSFSDHFILKGASVFSVWLGPLFRATRDADLHYSGTPSPDFLMECFKKICLTDVPPDGIKFDLDTMAYSEIKKEQQYKGTRITFSAHIDQAKVSLQFDIAAGDVVFPAAEAMEYPELLDMGKPWIKVYPQYTVIAEKFQTLTVLGMKNSRLKDFFDLWLLSESFDFDFLILQTAVQKTFERRKTKIPEDFPVSLTEEFYSAPLKQSQWNAFIKKVQPQKAPASLEEAVQRIRLFLHPFIIKESKPDIWKAALSWQ